MLEEARWGVFTLGNDYVLDWLFALFGSVRLHSPTISLRLIPYDDHLDRTLPLLDAFGVELYSPEELHEWDAIGASLYPEDPRSAHVFRKLAAFSSEFSFHLFCDADVVALAPVEEVLLAAEQAAPDLVYFDRDADQVYRPGALRDRFLEQGKAQGFNSGLYVGKRNSLSARAFRELLTLIGPAWRSDLVANAEQPFLNLFADHYDLSRMGQWELLSNHCSTAWAAAGDFRDEGGTWRLRGTSRWDEGWRLLFCHWAGFRLIPEMPNRRLFDLFAGMGKAKADALRGSRP